MSETKQKKKKKKQQALILQTEELSESGQELVEFLEELEKEKKYLDVQICPECKSPKSNELTPKQGICSATWALSLRSMSVKIAVGTVRLWLKLPIVPLKFGMLS
jgi:hypothetical protein